MTKKEFIIGRNSGRKLVLEGSVSLGAVSAYTDYIIKDEVVDAGRPSGTYEDFGPQKYIYELVDGEKETIRLEQTNEDNWYHSPYSGELYDTEWDKDKFVHDSFDPWSEENEHKWNEVLEPHREKINNNAEIEGVICPDACVDIVSDGNFEYKDKLYEDKKVTPEWIENTEMSIGELLFWRRLISLIRVSLPKAHKLIAKNYKAHWMTPEKLGYVIHLTRGEANLCKYRKFLSIRANKFLKAHPELQPQPAIRLDCRTTQPKPFNSIYTWLVIQRHVDNAPLAIEYKPVEKKIHIDWYKHDVAGKEGFANIWTTVDGVPNGFRQFTFITRNQGVNELQRILDRGRKAGYTKTVVRDMVKLCQQECNRNPYYRKARALWNEPVKYVEATSKSLAAVV